MSRLAAMTTLAVFASTGAAFASCTPQATTTPFAQWGDTGSYFLAPGGSFEGTAAQVGWTLNNASLTAGNEPFYVNSATDSQSLTINAGGSAASPYFCMDSTMPAIRFFAHELAPGTDLKVEGVVQTQWGLYTLPITDIGTPGSKDPAHGPRWRHRAPVHPSNSASFSTWAPVQSIALMTGLLPKGDSVPVSLVFEAPLTAGSWQIDDVYVDPYRAG